MQLTPELVEFNVVDPADSDAQFCVREYFAELARRFEQGFDPALTVSPDVHRPPNGLFLVATLRADPVGCGGLIFGDDVADLKRMWVSPAARGLGLGRRLLTELERHAEAAGARIVRLETNKALAEAIALYRSSGYREVEAFNDELYANHWFEKHL